jgi:3-deoxy-D-manno-octulosonic-acid transferase
MIWWIYNFIFPIVFLFLLPHYLMRMLRRGGYARDFSQRFGCYGRAESELLDAPGQPIWIQAVSVGELSIALSFMDELRRREPGIRFVLTTNTSTGHALALQKVHAPDVTLYFPMDVPLVMRRALRRIRPAIVVLIENEMWPNLIRTAEKRGIPTIMVNGRISENSFKGYRKIRFITRDLLPRIRWFCVQSAADRDRLLYLGAPPEKVEITGSAKYDLPATPPTAVVRAQNVLAKLRPADRRLILVGGSTWPGEEDFLADLYGIAKAQHPELLLVLVPRHAERREAVLEVLRARNLSVVQRSQFPDDASPPAQPPDVLLVDTTGELRGFYANADLVFVGKSLTEVGGQNPIEPARDGKPIVVGPHMENFRVIAADFTAARAWIQARDADDLRSHLLRLLDNAPERARLGEAAAALVARSAGATSHMSERILALKNR